MSKKIRLLALALILVFALSSCSTEETSTASQTTPAPTEEATVEATEEVTEEVTEEITEEATEDEPQERVVLMTLGGLPVYQDDVEYYSNLTYMYYMYGMLDYYYDALDSLQYILYYDIASKLLTAGKTEELIGEGYDELVMNYGIEFDGYVEQYASDYMAEEGFEGTQDDATQAALEYLASMGYTRDSFIEERVAYDAYMIYLDSIEADVSDEEVEELFNTRAAEDKEAYENNISMYDYYVMYMGDTSYYAPEGYRGILHILIGADEDLLNAYSEAEDDEAKQAAAEAVIASVQDTLDEIYAAYEAGTPFTELIEKYNIDPGMQSEDNLATGYLVHKDGSMYVAEFTAGSFSDEMQAPGDVSKPVVTNYGVHILYYLNDIPGGIVELTDDIREVLRDELIGNVRYEYVISLLKQYDAVYYPAYDEYIGEKNFLDD